MQIKGFSTFIKDTTGLIIYIILSTTSMLQAVEINAEEISSSGIENKEDKVVYHPIYFDIYSPHSAIDMINKIPGFTLQSESGDRGFGQGEGNLLINGKRPSSKSEKATDPLRRIASSSVLFIEVLKNGSSELAGQSGLIVNVVIAAEDNFSGTWSGSLAQYEKGDLNTSFGSGINGKKGNLQYSAELRFFRNQESNAGEEIVYDGNNSATERREETLRSPSNNYRLNLNLGWNDQSGTVANLNLSTGYSFWRLYENSRQFERQTDGTFDSLTREDLYSPENDWYPSELSGDYSFPLAGGSLKFVALQKYDYRKRLNRFSSISDDDSYQFRSTIPATRKESILRSIYSTTIMSNHSLEFALEAAINSLSTSPTFEENTGDGFEEILIPGSNVHVVEKRSESSVLYGFSISPAIQFQANLAVEYSVLDVKDIPDSRRSYLRPKGFVSLNFQADTNTQIKLRLARHVSQLNLIDFTSFVTPSEGTDSSGNLQIKPEQKWRVETTAEHRFGNDNVLSMTLFKEEIDDKVAFVPLETGGEGLGNLDNSSAYGFETALSLSTESFGISGGRLNITAAYNKSELTDPVSNLTRAFDRYIESEYEIKFRQDVPKSQLAWDFSVRNSKQANGYRLDQITSFSTDPYTAIAIEHKDIGGVKVRLEAYEVVNENENFTRSFYQQSRQGEFIGRESRSRKRESIILLSFASTF